MATLHDRDRDISDYREHDRNSDDREISLGTGTILGIFFALALLCAIFFGFGYSVGRKSIQTTVTAATPLTTTPGGIFTSFKPAAGNPGGASAQRISSSRPDTAENTPDAPKDPDGEIVTSPVSSSDDISVSAKPNTHPPTPKPASDAPAAARPAPTAMPATSPNGTTMVQVAAVSHQEDADTLIAALKKKGYAVFIRQEPQDHLLHVQIGPFGTHKEADVMRQHLLADGYNAIVK